MKISLCSAFADVEEVEAFSRQLDQWRPDRLVLAPTDWQVGGRADLWLGQVVGKIREWKSYPFGLSAAPGFGYAQDAAEVRHQLEIMDSAYRLCQERRIEFVPAVVLPKFPYNDLQSVRSELPHLFKADGALDLQAPGHLDIIRGILSELYSRYPGLAGVEVWLAEGAGPTIHGYTVEDLEDAQNWLDPWLEELEGFGVEHGVEVTVFAHQYVHTRATRRITHGLLQRRPVLNVLEDLTWPGEHTGLRYLGYLEPAQAEELARKNPLHINFLLDTEYVGQGRIPSVLPDWIAGGILACSDIGAAWAHGRINYWDDGATLRTWNALNTDIFCSLARDPSRNPRAVLAESLRWRYGPQAEAFCDLLFEGQAAILFSQTINLVPLTDHSAFPTWHQLHPEYYPGTLKTVVMSDLFKPPGTRLSGGPIGTLDAGGEWRRQLELVARPVSSYLADQDWASAHITKLAARASVLAERLEPSLREFVVKSYALWQYQAAAHRLFTEAAAAHAAWTKGEGSAASTMKTVADRIQHLAEDLASQYQDLTLFELGPRMRDLARFLRDPLPVQLR